MKGVRRHGTRAMAILIAWTALWAPAGASDRVVPPRSGPVGTESRELVALDPGAMEALGARRLPTVYAGSGFLLAAWSAEQRGQARDAGISFEVIASGFRAGDPVFVLEVAHGGPPPAAWEEFALFSLGRKHVLAISSDEARRWETLGFPASRVGARPLESTPRSTRVAYDCSNDPAVEALLDRTSQTRWLDWIEKLSGEQPVTVGGAEVTSLTRSSSSLFSGVPLAPAFDFSVEQLQAWHYPPANLEEHPYPVSGGATWKNLVATIPGQTFPDEIVLITAHLDSTSPSASTYAPGANDNGTGAATLFEAARLFRQFRFGRTIQIVWFTGEEQNLLGSQAFVADHPTEGFLGAVNLDMFGWDGDDDRCFEIHVGSLPQSLDIGSCYRDSLESYDLGLAHDFLTGSLATDRSDHRSFWQVGVGALEIAENFFNDNLPDGCAGQDANPGYHTTSDTIGANLMPSFGFDVARAGLATVAAMALPIEACFASAPVLTATPDVTSVALSWTSVTGADRYRAYRSTQGCQGQWFEVSETTATNWTDHTAGEAIPYDYHVEAVAPDGFCVSAPSACETAEPTVSHAAMESVGSIDVCASGGPGHGDGVIDPGESVLLPISLANDGNVDLKNIEGTFSVSTPEVTILDSFAAWPDLAAGASAVSRPNHVGMQLDPAVPCGARVDATIDLNYIDGGNSTGFQLTAGGTQQIDLLDEDFAGGIPAGWTVVDGGVSGGAAMTWATDNPGGRTIDEPFAGTFAIVDSDEAGSGATQDEALVTPPIDATGCATVTLSFSNQFHWYGFGQDEIADVDVSTDGGVGWTGVHRMQGADDGYSAPNVKLVDLTTAIAPNPSNVRIRFRYHQASYEWWWAIDDVQVTCASPQCTPCAEPFGAPGEPGELIVGRDAGDLVLAWSPADPACDASGYGVYRGDLATLRTGQYLHETVLGCSLTGPELSFAVDDPDLGEADYFLVVAENGFHEGSYGPGSQGVERPPSASACRPAQSMVACSP